MSYRSDVFSIVILDFCVVFLFTVLGNHDKASDNKFFLPVNYLLYKLFRLYKSFNLSWLIVWMSYHRFNNLAGLFNRDLVAKIGRGIISKDLMDIECNYSFSYKVNGKCVCGVKCRSKCLIYEVKYSMCETIYTVNTDQTIKNNGWSFLWYLTSTQERAEIRFICCPFLTALYHYYITYRSV